MLTLATAAPQLSPTNTSTEPVSSSIDTEDAYPSVYQHAVASSGNVAYAALPWATTTGTQVTGQGIKVWRSTDGGKTWRSTSAIGMLATGTAINAVIPGSSTPVNVDQVSIAIDAGSPDIVYVAFNFGEGSGLPGTVPSAAGSADCGEPAGCGGAGLFVSMDQGKTFTFHAVALTADVTGGTAPDVASPEPNTVVVAAPTEGGSPGISGEADGFTFFGDASNGSTLTGCPDACPTGVTSTLSDSASGTYIQLGAGSHLFVLPGLGTCYTFVASLGPSGLWEPRAQCTTGMMTSGPAFGPELKPLAQPQSNRVTSPSGALEFDFPHMQGVLALTWSDEIDNSVSLATATLGLDASNGIQAGSFTVSSTAACPGLTCSGPATLQFPPIPVLNGVANGWEVDGAVNSDVAFDAVGNLWLAYQTFDNVNGAAIAVDKSCDQGTTWSGGVFASSYAGLIAQAAQAQFPGLVPVSCPTTAPCGDGMAVSALANPAVNAGANELFFRLLP
jgi:hypothetical protein